MTLSQTNWRRIVAWLLISIPLGALALNALSWLVYGTDLPFIDDWNDYYHETATSFSMAHLFAKGNDTIFPIGRAFDVLAQIVLHGNSIAYQFISMICVLGFFLFIQWRLLSSTFNDRLIAASLFCFSIFMIEPYTYWGLQNNAYVQAIPFMGVMATIYVFAYIFARRDGFPRWTIPAVFVLGLVTGLAYISGPFMEIAVAIVFLCATLLRDDPEKRGRIGASLALLLASISTAILQIGVILVLQKGELHRPDEHWAFPNDGDYWFFMLGKVGRALALQDLNPTLSIALVTVVVLATAAIFIWYARRAYKGLLTEDREARVAFIFCSVAAANFVYLNEVSAGRARGFRPPSAHTALGVFAFGFQNRFHFFPLTLLWPWLAAAVLLLLLKFSWFSRRDYLVPLAALAVVVLAAFGGVFDNASDYRSIAAMRAGDIACLQSQMLKGKRIHCPTMPGNFFKILVYARSVGSSFTKYLQLVPIPFGTDNPPPLFRLSASPSTVLTPHNAMSLNHTPQSWTFESANNDPQVWFKTGAEATLRHCQDMQVGALIHAKSSDFAELFFEPRGQTYFSQAASQAQQFQIEGSYFTEVEFNLISMKGFTNQFRLDVVQSKQPFAIKDIEVRCRLSDDSNPLRAATLKTGSQH